MPQSSIRISNPVSVKYGSYRYFGPLDLVFEPVVLVPELVLWAAAWFFLWWREWLHLKTGLGLGLLLVLLLVVAHFPVHLRLGKTVSKFLNESAPSILKGHAYVIAHSLGSYLVCTALQNEPTMFARRVVLAGCVVNRDFAWQNLLGERKIAAVRNEVAGRDYVPIAAKLLRWRYRDFGSAGHHGFRGDASLIHTVTSPNQTCSTCPAKPPMVPVHNFISAKAGHSGALTATYAKYYWLPFFWDIDPSEFRVFLDNCHDMIKAFDDGGSPDAPLTTEEFDKLADAFMARPWAWAGGYTIPEYLFAAKRPVPDAGDYKIIAFNMCRAVITAETALGEKIEMWRKDPLAHQGYKSDEHDNHIKALYPRTALTRAYLAYKNPVKPA